MKQLNTILHIINSFDTGGLEKFVIDLIKCTSNSFNHKVLCLDRTGELAELCDIQNIFCLDLKPGIQWKALLDIGLIIRTHKIDLIHTHNEKAQCYGSLAGFICRIPVVHTKHGKNRGTFKSCLRNNLLARFCTKIVSVSQDTATECITDEKIPEAKVMKILNGTDTKAFCPGNVSVSIKSELGIENNIPVIGIVARLNPVKDHATLFAACRFLKESGCEFRLLVVGDGPIKHEVIALAEKLNLGSTVVFTGVRSDIPALMNIMDIFVLSSISEGVSLTLIEAMACELPIVATSVGGNPEVVVQGETGFLVPPQEPEQMAERIQQLLNSATLRKTFGERGRLRVIEQFSMKRVGQQYETLYRSVLGE